MLTLCEKMKENVEFETSKYIGRPYDIHPRKENTKILENISIQYIFKID